MYLERKSQWNFHYSTYKFLFAARFVKTTITAILESLLIKPKHVQIAQKRN